MAYTRRTCHECGFRDIQPNMQQKTVQVTAGKSKSSVSLATFVGAAFGHKKSGRAIGNSILNSDQRTYTRTKTIYLCDNCSGVAAARNARLAKERAQQEKTEAAEKKKQERAAQRAIEKQERAAKQALDQQARAERQAIEKQAYVARRESERQAHAAHVQAQKEKAEQEALRQAEIKAQESLAKAERQAMARDLKEQEKRAKHEHREAKAALKAELLQKRKEQFSLLTQRLADGQLDARDTSLVKLALRNKLIAFVRTLVEAVGIVILVSFVSAIALSYDLQIRIVTVLLIGFPLYLFFGYALRARKITSARQALQDAPLEMRDTA